MPETYVLTASTDELQKFLLKYGEEIDIFKMIERNEVLSESSPADIQLKLETLINKYMESDAITGNDQIYSNLRKIQ